MKIIRRSFGENYALLELADGDYYHLPLDSKYIPSVDDDLVFDSIDLETTLVCYRFEHFCSRCLRSHVEMYYLKTEPHHLKEL